MDNQNVHPVDANLWNNARTMLNSGFTGLTNLFEAFGEGALATKEVATISRVNAQGWREQSELRVSFKKQVGVAQLHAQAEAAGITLDKKPLPDSTS